MDIPLWFLGSSNQFTDWCLAWRTLYVCQFLLSPERSEKLAGNAGKYKQIACLPGVPGLPLFYAHAALDLGQAGMGGYFLCRSGRIFYAIGGRIAAGDEQLEKVVGRLCQQLADQEFVNCVLDLIQFFTFRGSSTAVFHLSRYSPAVWEQADVFPYSFV